jgi:RNA polymerase sigma-70 factor (ECF subfamily)
VLADFVGRRAKNQPRLRAGLGSAEEIERARVERAKAKDPQVWQAWFDAYYPSLFKYAYLRVRSRAEAEDIVSQVFLEAVEGIRRYEYQGRPIVAWLYRIAHNLIADRLKRERRLEDLTDGVPSRTDFNLGPEEGIENIDLITALAELTEEQQ